MELDWVVIWQEFERELNDRIRDGVINSWDLQQSIIERAVERNLTPLALDRFQREPAEFNPLHGTYRVELPPATSSGK